MADATSLEKIRRAVNEVNLIMSCKENDTYIFDGLNYFFVSMSIAYVPVIICSSVLIISSVMLVKSLQNAHNYILVSIAVADILTCLFCISLFVIERLPDTRYMIVCSQAFCYANIIEPSVVLLNLALLTLLSFDSFYQINYPFAYRRHNSVKYISTCFISVVGFHVSVAAAMIGLRLFFYPMCRAHDVFVFSVGKGRLYFLSMLIIHLLLSIFFCTQIRVCRRERKNTLVSGEYNNNFTSWLLMVFIVLYIPTLIIEVLNVKNQVVINIVDLIRFSVPLTNGFLIYLSRPIYKHTFSFFLKTNPMEWKGVTIMLNFKRLKSVMLARNIMNVAYRETQQKRMPKLSINPETSSEVNKIDSSNHYIDREIKTNKRTPDIEKLTPHAANKTDQYTDKSQSVELLDFQSRSSNIFTFGMDYFSSSSSSSSHVLGNHMGSK